MVRLRTLRGLLEAGEILGREHDLRRSAIKVCGLFAQRLAAGCDPDVTLGFVPGRIELAGKHTDYAGGHTLVCAIPRGLLFVAAASSTGLIRIIEDSSEFAPLEFPFAGHVQPTPGSWANYPMTMAGRVASNFGTDSALSGVDIAFASDMPVGSGMSGSSALMMMCFCAIAMVNRLDQQEKFRKNIRGAIDLAMYLACAENGQSFRDLPGGKGVGTFGGSEDHTAILTCIEGAVSLYRYAPTAFKADLSWPSEWGLVLAFSGVRAEKTREAMEKYNMASRRASLAVDAYNRLYGKNLGNLGEIEAQSRGQAASRWLRELGDSVGESKAMDLPGRIKQFLREERETTPAAINALLWRNLGAFGDALNASHRASRRLLWNIAPEIDSLQKSAVALGAAGASGFGAGFGGSIFAVIEAEKAQELASAWSRDYARRHPERQKEAEFFLTSPGPGIRIWDETGAHRFVDLIFQA